MSIHKEIHLEDELCADLTTAGWLCKRNHTSTEGAHPCQ